MLRELGYGVIEAPDGPAALRFLDGYPGIRLLFTDIGLPGGVNGRQLADEASSAFPNMPAATSSARSTSCSAESLDASARRTTGSRGSNARACFSAPSASARRCCLWRNRPVRCNAPGEGGSAAIRRSAAARPSRSSARL